VIVDVPVFPPAAALMTAVPAATPVTSPEVETVATVAFEDDQTKAVAEPPGLAVATNCCVAVAATVAVDGVTDTDLTGFGGPPLANDGDRLSAAGGFTVSEQAANAVAAARKATPPRTVVRVRIASVTWR
jgi:hypothetical protein